MSSVFINEFVYADALSESHMNYLNVLFPGKRDERNTYLMNWIKLGSIKKDNAWNWKNYFFVWKNYIILVAKGSSGFCFFSK